MADFSAKTEEAQKARLAALKGKKCLWLTCFYTWEVYEGLKPTMQAIMGYGVEAYVVFGQTDNDRDMCEKMKRDGLLTGGALWCDMADVETAADNIYKVAMESGVNFDGVFSPHEQVQTLVGELADRMKLPGNTARAYINGRDKRVAREVCKAAGVPTPGFGKLTSHDDVEPLIAEIGLPVVLKPSAGAGSEGVFLATTIDEVHRRYEEIRADMMVNPTFNWNPGCEVVVLVEEYIDGDEFDVDVLMWQGTPVYAGLVDNWPTMEPTFLETGSNCPSTYTGTPKKQLEEYAVDCIRALGFTQGAFHVELKYSRKPKWTRVENGETLGQPLLIEVNPRMGGGRTHKFHLEVWGVDLLINFFMTAVGIPINPPKAPEPLTCMCDYDICAMTTGVYEGGSWLDEIKAHPQVLQCEAFPAPGTSVKGADTGLPEWIGVIIVQAKTPKEAVALMHSLVDDMKQPIRKAEPKEPETQDNLALPSRRRSSIRSVD